MDERRFDALARTLGSKLDRRITIRAAIAGALAAVAARAGDDVEAAPESEACRRIGTKCNRKKHRCCFGGRCSKKRCRCARGQKQCRRTCIPQGNCCTDADCGANSQCLRSGACAPLVTCTDPLTVCGSDCVDTQADDDHCGACGQPCANNETCRDGACFVIVTPSNLNGWVNELPPQYNTNYLPVSFVAGPGNAPLGTGSAKFAIDSSGSSRVSIRYPALADAKLSSLTELRYSTYMENGGATNVVVPAIKLPSDTGLANPTFTTFIYEPAYSGGAGIVQPTTWQSWNALANDARWWSSRDIPDPANPGQFVMCNPNGGNATTPACTGKLYVPWSTVLQAAPDAELNAGGIQIETGSGTANAIGYTDALVVNGTTFDFEPDPQGATGKSGKASRTDSGRNRKPRRGGGNRR